MTISLGSNQTSLVAQDALGNVTHTLAKSSQRLSSGLRINDASDDAAGLAIASQLNSKARVYTQAVRNVNDGVSAASIAEGALTALKDISTRQLQLAEEAANGTYSLTQRQALNKEANALVDEYNRIASNTSFNGRNLFDPSLGNILIQAGYGKSGSLTLGLNDQLQRTVGRGQVRTQVDLDPSSTTGDVQAGDFNGDGNADVLEVDYNSGVRLLLGNGNGTFKAAISVSPQASLTVAAVSDINGDGKLDVVVSGYRSGTIVLLGNGDGTFGVSATPTSNFNDANDVQVGDFNGDGKKDFVLCQYDGPLEVFYGNGDGTFKSTTQLGTTPEHDMVIGDFNGDGISDIAAANYSTTLNVFFGSKTGVSLAKSTQNFAASPSNLKQTIGVGDLNGDGKLDLIGSDASSLLTIAYGNGDGTFRLGTQPVQFANPTNATVGDINGDGFDDVVAADVYGGGGAILLGNGDGSFRNGGTFPITATIINLPSLQQGGVRLADFNNDGALDVVSPEDIGGGAAMYLSNTTATTSSKHLNLNTRQGALDALNAVQTNLDRIEAQLGVIGATTSRMQIATSNLQTQHDNFLDASSRISDVDVASESGNVLRATILQQAAASVLTQANQQPALALKLLS